MTSIDSTAGPERVVAPADDFVRTGPGTPAGRYLRRYWQPIYVSDKLASGTIVPIKILGESLALYRGESGTPRLMGKGLQVQFTVDDAKTFTAPWSATVTFRRTIDPWDERVCAENLRNYGVAADPKVPTSATPDF